MPSKTAALATKVTAKQAVESAFAALTEFYPNQQLFDLALEEVDKSDDGRHWLITLSFSAPSPKSKMPAKGTLGAMLNPNPELYDRKLKVFQVDTGTGQVKSMKIRTL